MSTHFVLDEPERIWLALERPVPDREWHMKQSSKLMETVVWSVRGFHRVIALPMGFKFNTAYCTSELLQGIKDWRERQRVDSTRKSSVHPRDVRADTNKMSMDFLQANRMWKASDPPQHSSLDLPS
jgi:hypothetical protein